MMTTPSEKIIMAASAVIETTDRNGRQIKVRRLAALDRLRLFKALGSTLVENSAYFTTAYLAAATVEIDSVPIPWPSNELQIEAIVARLGDGGLDAVSDILAAAAATVIEATTAGN
jgi:hypothetical protein